MPFSRVEHARCDTDAHLLVESPAVPGRLAGILAVAVNCSMCRRSRVLETTAEYIAALPSAHPAKRHAITAGLPRS
jgi:hypothetical protein